MAHLTKYSAASAGHLTAHYERKKNELGEYIKFGNKDIEPSKTHLNYNLGPERDISQAEFIKQRTSEVRCLKRPDVNLMCSWVVTLPKNIERADGGKADTQRAADLFFARAYDFLENRYGGKENVISAYVHQDEAQPHMHFAFVPVVEDKKRGDLKVSAKEAVNREDLRSFHTDLESHLDSFGDYRFEVINEATKDGNKTIEELKAESRKELAAQEVGFYEAIDELTEELHDVQNKVTDKEQTLADIDYAIENRLERADRLRNDIERIGADAERELDRRLTEKAAKIEQLDSVISEKSKNAKLFENFLGFVDKVTGSNILNFWQMFLQKQREGKSWGIKDKNGYPHTFMPSGAQNAPVSDLRGGVGDYKAEIAKARQRAEYEPDSIKARLAAAKADKELEI